jgi:hypothetical protein
VQLEEAYPEQLIKSYLKFQFHIGAIRRKNGGKYWLQYIAGIWDGASYWHPADELDVLKNHLEAEGGSLECWYQGLKGVFDAIYENEMFSIDIRLNFDDDVLTAEWHGMWTRGRFLKVTVSELECRVEWDTATGKESTFLALPSSAVEFFYSKSGKEKVY